LVVDLASYAIRLRLKDCLPYAQRGKDNDGVLKSPMAFRLVHTRLPQGWHSSLLKKSAVIGDN
jgi:hypothetical protein